MNAIIFISSLLRGGIHQVADGLLGDMEKIIQDYKICEPVIPYLFEEWRLINHGVSLGRTLNRYVVI